MNFSFEFSGSAEQVFALITDPQFIVDRCSELGSLDADCESDGEDLPNIKIVRTEQAELPSMMKKIVGEQQEMQTDEQWSETEEAFLSSSTTLVKGTPISIKAEQSIINTEGGSEITVKLLVKAKVPILGKQIEPMVASKVRKEMLREFEYIESALS